MPTSYGEENLKFHNAPRIMITFMGYDVFGNACMCMCADMAAKALTITTKQ